MSQPLRKLPEEGLDAAVRDLIKATGARIRVGYPRWLRIVVKRGIVGVTIGNRIYLHHEVTSREMETIEAILIHELTHVRQFQRLGLPRFLYLYLREYLELRGSGMSPAEAYSNISLEVEASLAEQEIIR